MTIGQLSEPDPNLLPPHHEEAHERAWKHKIALFGTGLVLAASCIGVNYSSEIISSVQHDPRVAVAGLLIIIASGVAVKGAYDTPPGRNFPPVG